MSVARTPKSAMPVVILCGGEGTRMREKTEYVPKPMVEIGQQPILWHLMKIYGHYGLERFVLCLGYKAWAIKEYFLRYNEYLRDFTIDLKHPEALDFHNRLGHEAWRVTLAETGLEAGTGARLKRIARYIDGDTFLFTYGDAVGRVDIDALIDFHYRSGTIATVTGVHPTSRFGEMKVRDGRVVEFNEKPTVAEGVVSGGFFVLNRRVFDYLSDDPQLFFELEPLQRLARDGQLSVYVHDAFWHSMDTYRDYLALNRIWAAGDAPWKLWKD